MPSEQRVLGTLLLATSPWENSVLFSPLNWNDLEKQLTQCCPFHWTVPPAEDLPAAVHALNVSVVLPRAAAAADFQLLRVSTRALWFGEQR